MKKIVFYFLLLVFCLSCEEPVIFKDDELSLPKQEYTGKELKIDGYYYIKFNNIFEVFFLYKDGIITYAGTIPIEDLSEREKRFQNGEFYNHIKNIKFFWGVFNIKNNQILYERWCPSEPPYRTYVREGNIINDTTFVITKLFRMVNGKKTEESELNEVYHFKQFSPKPDSTNKFIK